MSAAAVLLCALNWAQPAEHANLVQNPGFEQLQDGKLVQWNMPDRDYSLDETVRHSGARSLKLSRSDPVSYVHTVQVVPCVPGEFYELSGWIKTEDVRGKDYGASLCLEWSDADGKWLGGHYPAGFKGTVDWSQLKAITPRVPDKAARVTLLCYLRKKMTGTAWFDDLSLVRGKARPLWSLLLSPSYRGLLAPGQREAEVAVRLDLRDCAEDLDQVQLSAATFPAGSRDKPLSQRVITPTETDFHLKLPAPEPAGRYNLSLALRSRANGKVLAEDVHQLERTAGEIKRTVYIDEHNRVILEGKPFFPLGLYCHGGGSEVGLKDADLLADSPFNCVMNYGINYGGLETIRKYLDYLDAHHLKIIYSTKDVYEGSRYAMLKVGPFEGREAVIKGLVQTFRAHPALLGWYLNDELPRRFLPKLRENYQWTKQLDPDHPTWIVLYQIGELEHYLDTCDAIGTDPYPVPSRPLTMVGDWTRRTVAAVEGRRSVWMVPQLHAKKHYSKNPKDRAPTYDEIRNMTYQCLINGAKGLVYYSLFDLRKDGPDFDRRWQEVKSVAAEVARLAPLILSVEPQPRVASDQPQVEVAAWTLKGQTVIAAANVAPEACRATIKLPLNGRRPQPLFKARKIAGPVTAEGLTDEFAPYAVHVYQVQR